MVMKRFSAPPTSVYPDPSRPPNDDDSEASLSDGGGSKKVKTAQSFESLFNSESLSDIIMDVNNGQYVFHAHKMIVGLKSERLAALITSVINSSGTQDSNTNGTSGSGSGNKPVLYLQEEPECSAVFSRFLYFIYSGAVWLHRDYVVPLFQLSLKYGVGALATHCENYIHQLLNKCLAYYSANESSSNTSSTTVVPPTLPLSTICDLCEEDGYRDDIKKAAFAVLNRRFPDLIRTERWISCRWRTVRDLLYCDDCACDENLILVAATDWMKRNKVQDKSQIQDILAAIRYPRLPRRVLYHLHATASFKNFPVVQDLISAAIRYHCFKDVPEAQPEFSGLQYRARGGRSLRSRHTVCGGETLSRSSSRHRSPNDDDGNNNNNEHCGNFLPHSETGESIQSIQTSCDSDTINMNGSAWEETTSCGLFQNPDILPPCARSCVGDTSHHHFPPQNQPHRNSPRRCNNNNSSHQHGQHTPRHHSSRGGGTSSDLLNHHHHHHHHNNHHHQHSRHRPAIIPDTLTSTFHPSATCCTNNSSPVVAAVQPRVQQPARSPSRDSDGSHDRALTPDFELEIDFQPQTQV